jgi:hypothetical protein
MPFIYDRLKVIGFRPCFMAEGELQPLGSSKTGSDVTI